MIKLFLDETLLNGVGFLSIGAWYIGCTQDFGSWQACSTHAVPTKTKWRITQVGEGEALLTL